MTENGDGETRGVQIVLSLEMKEPVIRFLEKVENGLDSKRWKDDEDWPVVVRWSKEYPATHVVVRRVQCAFLALDKLFTGDVKTGISMLVRVLFGRLLSFGHTAMKAPGSGLLAFARFVIGEKRSKTMLEPVIADMHAEYFEAKVNGRHWHARMALARGYYFALRPFMEPVVAICRGVWKLLGPQ